jgi:hypothetical protein
VPFVGLAPVRIRRTWDQSVAERPPRNGSHKYFRQKQRWSAQRLSIVGNSTSAWRIDYTVDDPTGAFPNPTLGASAPTVFSSMSGSSTATYGTFSTPFAAIRLTINALSSVGGKVTATILQAGIG